MLSHRKQPNATLILSGVASLAASIMLVQNVSNVLIPYQVRSYFFSKIRDLSRHFSSELTIVVDEYQANIRNQVFEAAHNYLGHRVTSSVDRVSVNKAEGERELAITVGKYQEVIDVFRNVQVRWRLTCRYVETGNNTREEKRSYELSFHKKHKEMILPSYFSYLLEQLRRSKEERRDIKLRLVDYRNWDSCEVTFDHPMTFETLAMDPELKKAVLDDLNTFMETKEFYRRTGRAWKRGYLLHGPPGTGKSSLIAAMANHLHYDIYDLDLTGFQNPDLRSLWFGISSRSIIVVEDIDCTFNLQNRESTKEADSDNQNQVTLSALLNVIDGVWSCLGNERIIVFTANYKDRIDPALLRPGRMDMHIHMSYCTFSVFKQLALSYLGVSHHKHFDEIEELIKEVEVTPAQVAGELMKSLNADVSLQSLVEFLYEKKFEPEEPETTDDIESPEFKEWRARPPIRGLQRGRRRGRGRPFRR